MFSVGDVVILSREGEQKMGEVARVASLPFANLYDVSLEDAVVKGVLEEDLLPVGAAELRAFCGWLSMDPGLADAASSPTDLSRRLYLRQRYVDDMRNLLDRLERRSDDLVDSCVEAAYGRGERVLVRDGGSLLLGVVAGCVASKDSVAYTVDVLGESRTIGSDGVGPLSQSQALGGRFELGGRVRFLVPGCEDDEEYLATVCGIAPDDRGMRYAIAFDDGDILEDLGEDDLGHA